mgnify:CR=1 FL=1
MSETKDVLAAIYGSLDRALALADLKPQDKGGYYLLTCPKCGGREAYVYKAGAPRLVCNRRDKCGLNQSLWDYVQGARGLDNRETLQELARLAGHELPALGPDALERIERARAQANAWETALEYFRHELEGDAGGPVREYLQSRRGYSVENIRGMEAGLFTSTKALAALFKSRGIDAADAGPVLEASENIGAGYPLIFPYRDPAGHIRGFILRAIKPSPGPKYLYTRGLKRTPFNLDRARGKSTLIVVEGILDALAIRERAGLANVIALGDASLSDEKLEHALAAGAGAFILALDNDAAGADGTERALAVIRKHNARAYVLELPAGIKDPDDLIRERGPAAFVELTKSPISGARWIAGRILSRHDIGKDLGRDAAIEEAIAYEDGLADPIETADLMDAITGALGLEPETLEHRLTTYKEKRAREDRRRGYQELFTRGQALLKDGDLDGLREYVDEKARDLNARALVTLPAALYTMEQFERELAETPEGLKTGYESLDGLFSIPQEAITIVAGRPSHGKTTFLMNLALNMAGLYADRSFFFFSYEESKAVITAKLVNILGGTEIDAARNFQALEAYLKEQGRGRKSYPQIDAGRETLRGLMNSGRLWIIDAPLYVDELADALATFRERYKIGAVFIDYIQKIKARGKYPTRQVEIQKISERILEAAKGLSIPVILGAQLGRDKERADKVRLDNLRESGDIEQDANLVLGLHNPAMEKAQAGEIAELTDRVDLTLTVLKNRNGRVNVEQALTFNRPLLRIEESQKAAASFSRK